ncbi:hypothetical protein SuUB63_20560 [Streptococcus uberis]
MGNNIIVKTEVPQNQLNPEPAVRDISIYDPEWAWLAARKNKDKEKQSRYYS